MDGDAREPRRGAERLTAWLVVAGTVVASAAASPWLGERLGTVALVSPDDPWVRLDGEVTAEFGLENPVLWVIEARAGTIWTRPALTSVVEITRGALRIPGVRAGDVMSIASPNVRQVLLTDGGISPQYVMASVPATEAGIAALEHRVSSDENLSGTLVTRDGRAAIVVANFAPDADGAAVARAALELADRADGEAVRIHTVGAPVLAEQARRFASGAWRIAVAALLVAVFAAALLLGASRLLAVAVGIVLATLWSGIVLALAGALVWPWSGLALLPAAGLAAITAVACEPTSSGRPAWPRVLAVGSVLVIGFGVFAVVTPSPVRAFGVAGAVAGIAAVVAGRVAAPLTKPTALSYGFADAWLSVFALAVVAAALLGLPLLTSSFALSSYGERYLPESAAESLKSVRRVMAPPTQLAIRVRGEPGSLANPDLLLAMDEIVGVARRDARVERAQSLADIVKLVHRTFNDGDPESAALPDDRGLIARYLALAYSPAFRRFVDRGFGRSAIWFHLSSDRPSDVAEVIGELDAALERAPLPGAEGDAWAGDGAMLVVMARLGRDLAAGAAGLVAGVVFAAGILLGWRTARFVAIGAVAATLVVTGGLGWLGIPLDLLSLAAAAGAAAAGTGAGAWRGVRESSPLTRLAVVVAVEGFLGVLAPLVAVRILGLQLLGLAAAILVVRRLEGAAATR